MTRSRGILQPRVRWNGAMDDWLRDLYPNHSTAKIALFLGLRPGQVYNRAKALELKKSPAYLASPEAGRLSGKDTRGGATRFQKGQKAWNAGTKGVVGVQAACRKTQFKPGQSPANTLPIGSLKFDASGTLLRKVSNSPGNNSKRWRAVHEIVWVQANGPVPPKHIVVFKPGMRTGVLEQITLDRVECISLAENMRRNTVHRLPAELVEVTRMRAVLTRYINQRSKAP